MSTLCIHIEKEKTDASRFRAVLGDRHSTGQTVGQAIDALLSHWESPIEQAEVFIEEPQSEQTEGNYIEPHLVNEGGFWVIAGGEFSHEDAQRDFVAEMREERIRSFFPTIVKDKTSE